MQTKNILVVDDEKDCCDFFKKFLDKHGYSVDIAYNGLQAKHLIEKNQYQYIFFDCNMPEITGVELVRIIDELNPKAKKFMISGYDLIKEEFAKDLGVDEFLEKPILLETIQKLLEDYEKK